MNLEPNSQSRENETKEKHPSAEFEHDIRNLTAAMQSAVEVIRFDTGLSAESKNMLEIFDRQLDLLIKMVNKFCNETSHNDTPSDRASSGYAPDKTDSIGLRQLDIMIVDDARLVAYTLQKMLEKLGQRVRTASNGASAIEAIVEKLPDIVFSDLGMAGMSGYELATRIRSLPQGGNVHLVALTGCSSLESKCRSRDAGFDEHYEKPIAFATLSKIVRGLA
jgi:CheY-like chemotaxis protein